jgi:hypothetical protein
MGLGLGADLEVEPSPVAGGWGTAIYVLGPLRHRVRNAALEGLLAFDLDPGQSHVRRERRRLGWLQQRGQQP